MLPENVGNVVQLNLPIRLYFSRDLITIISGILRVKLQSMRKERFLGYDILICRILYECLNFSNFVTSPKNIFIGRLDCIQISQNFCALDQSS
jgi:hypothetical protein